MVVVALLAWGVAEAGAPNPGPPPIALRPCDPKLQLDSLDKVRRAKPGLVAVRARVWGGLHERCADSVTVDYCNSDLVLAPRRPADSDEAMRQGLVLVGAVEGADLSCAGPRGKPACRLPGRGEWLGVVGTLRPADDEGLPRILEVQSLCAP
jgi:hypothetical protein